MTTLAKDAVPGKIYRLTREPGTTYYRICDRTAAGRLERRLSKTAPQMMRPDDLRTWKALGRCRAAGEVLGVRVIRYRSETGAPKELKSYVSIPPDYPLREVERPPGYGARRGYPREKGLDTAEPETETSETKHGDAG